MSIKDSQVVIRGTNKLINVGRDQYNNSNNQTIFVEVTNFMNETAAKRTEYDEFTTVKRGDIKVVKDTHSGELNKWEWNWETGQMVVGRSLKCRQTVCTVEIYPNRQDKFTAVFYEGDDAQAVWECGFERYSRIRFVSELYEMRMKRQSISNAFRDASSLQLFGLNRSEVPMLIFHDELIPLGHFYVNSFWGDVFLGYLEDTLKCGYRWNFWMNTKGTFCGGPKGPYFEATPIINKESILVPPTANMLQDDTSLHLFAKHKSRKLDKCILSCAHRRWVGEHSYGRSTLEDQFFKNHDQLGWTFRLWETPQHPPTEIVGGLRFDIIYSSSLEPVAKWPQGGEPFWVWTECDLEEEEEWEDWPRLGKKRKLIGSTLVGDGLNRFRLDTDGEFNILGECYSWKIGESWLAQSPRVMTALRMKGLERECFVVDPPAVMLNTPRSCQYDGLVAFFRLCDGEEPPSIYLFIHPGPSCIPELISWLDESTPAFFWSFNETGQTHMSQDECVEWGLPYFIPQIDDISSDMTLHPWPTDVYDALYDWQVVRGFDPTTADFARCLGYPELEILGLPKKRFERTQEGETNTNSHARVGVQTEGQRPAKKRAEIPRTGVVRPAHLQQFKNVSISTAVSMEAVGRSELVDGDACQLRSALTRLVGKF
ncbi:hypothetical protein VNI00_002370 [Paramarasmius palmivorus]|uniref:Uncharacterized protein n=1 Tax=Paramarasmius palmivorus TaxID=297713 RepID=A0AAW0DZF4_9AGAR